MIMSGHACGDSLSGRNFSHLFLCTVEMCSEIGTQISCEFIMIFEDQDMVSYSITSLWEKNIPMHTRKHVVYTFILKNEIIK